MSNNIELDGAELQALEIKKEYPVTGVAHYLVVRPTHGDPIKIPLAPERKDELKERLGVE